MSKRQLKSYNQQNKETICSKDVRKSFAQIKVSKEGEIYDS